jgi:replicative DNA helicase Mcm
MKRKAAAPFERQVAAALIKSTIASLPQKRKLPDAFLWRLFKQAVNFGVDKLILTPGPNNSTTSADLAPPALIQDSAPSPFILPQVQAFATKTKRGNYTVYDELPNMIAPHIEGARDLKLALCYSLASSPDYPVHFLMIGEPATVKTELLDEAKRIAPEAVLVGPRSTLSGLTLNATNGGPGVLVEANGDVALIDELDKLPHEAIKSLYEAMESGRITVNTAKVRRELESKFICIASANPKGDTLAKKASMVRWQVLKSIPVALLTRFHLVSVVKQSEGTELKNTINKILVRTDKENPDLYLVRNYFRAIRAIVPQVECELDPKNPAVRKAQKFLSMKIGAGSRGKLYAPLSVRAAEALKRLCMSSARMRLSPQVEDIDIRNALSIMKASLDTWSEPRLSRC